MNILTMLWKNLWGGSRTMLFPARPKVSEGFAVWCASIPRSAPAAPSALPLHRRAIEFKAGKGEFYWSYDPGQCTFCGRCVEGCKAHALSQDSECPPIYTTIGELKNSYTVARKPPAPKPAAAAPPPSRAGGKPRHWRRTMTPLESIPEKLGSTESWVEKGGVHWLRWAH
jgi:ferredoxin